MPHQPTTAWSVSARALLHIVCTVAGDVRDGLVETTRHSLALLGLALVAVALTFGLRPDLQQSASVWALEVLRERLPEGVPLPSPPDPAELSTARHLRTLEPEQAALAYSLRARHKVAAEPLAALITEAWALEERLELPATLLLAVAAVESRFNPFALGSGSARGLMQIDPTQFAAELDRLGGPLSVYDPLANFQLGALQLARLVTEHGDPELALQYYGMSSGHADGSLFAQRVLAERLRMDQVLAKAQRLRPGG